MQGGVVHPVVHVLVRAAEPDKVGHHDPDVHCWLALHIGRFFITGFWLVLFGMIFIIVYEDVFFY